MTELRRKFEVVLEAQEYIPDSSSDMLTLLLSEAQALDLYTALHEVFGGTCRREPPDGSWINARTGEVLG